VVGPRHKSLNIEQLDQKDFNVLHLPIIVVPTPLLSALIFQGSKLSTQRENGWIKPLLKIRSKR